MHARCILACLHEQCNRTLFLNYAPCLHACTNMPQVMGWFRMDAASSIARSLDISASQVEITRVAPGSTALDFSATASGAEQFPYMSAVFDMILKNTGGAGFFDSSFFARYGVLNVTAHGLATPPAPEQAPKPPADLAAPLPEMSNEGPWPRNASQVGLAALYTSERQYLLAGAEGSARTALGQGLLATSLGGASTEHAKPLGVRRKDHDVMVIVFGALLSEWAVGPLGSGAGAGQGMWPRSRCRAGCDMGVALPVPQAGPLEPLDPHQLKAHSLHITSATRSPGADPGHLGWAHPAVSVLP